MTPRRTQRVDLDLPAVRADVALRATSDPRYPMVLVDAAQQTRLGLDSVAVAIVSALDQPRSAIDVLGRVQAGGERRLSPSLLYKHLRHFARHGMLEGARADRLRGIEAGPQATGHEQATLNFSAGLRHACQACGSCCSATDVGPIPASVADRIAAEDWTQELPAHSAEDALFRSGEHEGQAVLLMKMRNDQCIFLDDDRLCRVHKRLGVEKKPTPCRQFPYVFSQLGDRIDVSLQMECRAYPKARAAAPAPETAAAELRALLAISAPVHQVPERIGVDPGLAIGANEYAALEAAIIADLRAKAWLSAEDDDLPAFFKPLVTYARSVNGALSTLYREIDADEVGFLRRSAWAGPFGGAFEGEADPWENFLASLERFQSEAVSFCDEGAGIADQRGLPFLGQRFRFLARSLRAVAGAVEPTSFRVRDPEQVASIVEDVLVASLFAKEGIRRGGDLRLGLALIGLKASLIVAGACDRAKEACRVEVAVHDIVDTMVVIGKMLRERAVLDLCESLKSLVISLFLTNLEVFAGAAKPRLESPGGIL